MARLAAQAKGEYYPTPLSVVHRIARHLGLPKKITKGRVVRMMDTSAGKGTALATLADDLKTRTNNSLPFISTWGVEINPTRAKAAKDVLDEVLAAPFQVASWKPARGQPVGLLFQNPPYDKGEDHGRMEVDFLVQGTKWLVPGGVLVWIIPHTTLNYEAVYSLVKWYEDIQVYRFPDKEYKAFGQIVVLAKRREEEVHPGYTLRKNCCWHSDVPGAQRELKALPVIGTVSVLYHVPVTPVKRRLFRAGYTLKELHDVAKATTKPLYDKLSTLVIPTSAGMMEPLMPPRTGHIAQMLAAGLMGTITTDDGKIVRGRVVKSVMIIPGDKEGEEKHIDKYTTHIVYLDKSGLTHLSSPKDVTGFLRKHVQTFEKYVVKNFPPYGNSVKPQEKKILDTLSLDKRLPGTSSAGLLPAQRKSAVALTRSIKRYGAGHLVAEMGYGKTRTALAAIELMNAYPALVICPPHLVDKWVREAKAAVPNAEAIVVEGITQFEAIRSTYRKGQKLILVMSRSKIKLGSGWVASYPIRHTLSDRKVRERFKVAMARYRMNPSPETRHEALKAAQAYPVCPKCGKRVGINTKLSPTAYLEKYPAHCTAPHEVWDADKGRYVVVKDEECHEALFQFSGYHRLPMADYIRKKAKGFFKVLVADEVHQYKGKGSDQGWAFQVLAHHIPRVITLTGTFFGGPSTSVFYLLYRTQRNVRDAFAFNGETEWARQFGVLEERWKEFDVKDEYGDFTAKKKRRVGTKEKPGISPEIMRYILPTVVFGRIADLGVPMPPLEEEVVTISPDIAGTKEIWNDLLFDLDNVYSSTWDAMLANWPHFTSAWLQWNLARPNSAFRDEEIVFPDRSPMVAMAVVNGHELLPKEEWLVETVRKEIADDHRVVVYVRQTGTRDIRQRIKLILEQAGISNVVILNENISPRKREKWLQGHSGKVLITNPRLVETGLDLVQYSTVIFYEITYSLYTLWQAMRRVWRLGQTKPVKIYYAVYADTLEEKALALIGQKMGAAQLLYGEDVTGTLVPEQEGSLVFELIKTIKEHQQMDAPTSGFFAPAIGDVVKTVTSPIGSPTVQSQQLSLEAWLAARGLTLSDVLARRRRGKKQVVTEQQMSLF